jgi:hypothetical protein
LPAAAAAASGGDVANPSVSAADIIVIGSNRFGPEACGCDKTAGMLESCNDALLVAAVSSSNGLSRLHILTCVSDCGTPGSFTSGQRLAC